MAVSKDVMDKFDKAKESRYFWPITIVFVIVFLAFFIGPKLTGFTVFSSELNQCKEDLGNCGENVDSLTTQKESLELTLTNAQNTIAERDADIKNMEDRYENDKDRWQQDYDDLADTFNGVVDNAGTNRCCKEWFDNRDIDSFNIKDNVIDCVEGGTFKIDCEIL